MIIIFKCSDFFFHDLNEVIGIRLLHSLMKEETSGLDEAENLMEGKDL